MFVCPIQPKVDADCNAVSMDRRLFEQPLSFEKCLQWLDEQGVRLLPAIIRGRAVRPSIEVYTEIPSCFGLR